MITLSVHGRGDEPSEEVLRCCGEFLCSLFCPGGVRIGEAKMCRWFLFKQLRDEQEVDKLPAPMEHGLNILCAELMTRLIHDTMIWY